MLSVSQGSCVAIVSDIHGNITALNAVLADIADASPDYVIHAGDVVGNGSDNAAVVDIVAGSGWPGVFGNTDEMLWDESRFQDIAR